MAVGSIQTYDVHGDVRPWQTSHGHPMISLHSHWFILGDVEDLKSGTGLRPPSASGLVHGTVLRASTRDMGL